MYSFENQEKLEREHYEPPDDDIKCPECGSYDYFYNDISYEYTCCNCEEVFE